MKTSAEGWFCDICSKGATPGTLLTADLKIHCPTHGVVNARPFVRTQGSQKRRIALVQVYVDITYKEFKPDLIPNLVEKELHKGNFHKESLKVLTFSPEEVV